MTSRTASENRPSGGEAPGVAPAGNPRSGRLALLGGLALAGGPAFADVVETRTLEESVPVESEAPRVVVENVFGSITVTGYDGATVEMTATETIRADTAADAERARAEVALRTEQAGDEVAFRVDDPGDCDCRGRRWDDYVVEYDIALRVPRGASLDLETVNGGDVSVDGVHGDFEVSNVNGSVMLAGLRGSGSAATVNGRIEASFERSPASDSSFETVNGTLDVAFPADLSADLALATMRGEIWTDFDVSPVAPAPVGERTRDGGRWVIRVDRSANVRVGAGGPTHAFETLNGDIFVRETAQ